MTEISDKLNADRAIRVWAVEQACRPIFGNFLEDRIVMRAMKLEHYVLNGTLKVDEPVPVMDEEFAEVEPNPDFSGELP